MQYKVDKGGAFFRCFKLKFKNSNFKSRISVLGSGISTFRIFLVNSRKIWTPNIIQYVTE